MSEKKQTAVMWLIAEQRDINLRFEAGLIDITTAHVEEINAVNKALKMERDQIEEAYGWDRIPCSEEDCKQYYTDTYGE